MKWCEPVVSRAVKTRALASVARLMRFEARSEFDVSAEQLWAFHMRPDALDVLTHPLMMFEVVDRGAGVRAGSVLEARVGVWPLRRRWLALHAAVDPGRSFADLAIEAPFPYWLHQHAFEALDGGRSRLTDVVWCVPPRWVPRPLVRIALLTMFRWRHRATRRFLERRGLRRVGRLLRVREAADVGGSHAD